MNATQDFFSSFQPLLIAQLVYASLLLGATLLSQTTLALFIGLILAKWACSLQNSALTSYWIDCLTSRLERHGLLLGEPFPISLMSILSKLSVLWTSGLSLEDPAPLELAQAGSCRVLRFNSSLS